MFRSSAERNSLIMKKILSVVLTATMLGGMLSGCGGEKQAENGGKETIEIWTSDASAKQCWNELTEEYNNGKGKKSGIEIKFKFITSQDEIDVAAQNDQLPDIVCPTFLQVKQLIKEGKIVALEDVEGLKEFSETYVTAKKENENVFDGKLYAVTTNTQTSGLIYNKDLFKEAGIVDENGEAKPPATLDEMVEIAKKLTNKDKGTYGYAFPLGFSTYYTMYCPAQNAYKDRLIVRDDNNYTYDYSNYFDLLSYMLKMREDGSLFPGADTLDNDTARAYFAEGLIGMFPALSWDVGVFTTQFVANCDWDVAPYPVKVEGESGPRFQSPGGQMFITSVGAAKGEKMAEAYKWLMSSEVITRFYENGIKIPYNPEMIEDGAKCDVKQFASFTDLVDDTYPINAIAPKISIEGDNDETLMKKVWAGDLTVEEALEDINKRYSEAYQTAVESGKVDVEHIKEVNGTK